MKRRSFIEIISKGAVASTIPPILFEDKYIHFSEPYRETRKEVIENLKVVNDENYDMSKVYDEESKPDIVQGNLRNKTRSLVAFVEKSLMDYGNDSYYLDFEDSLTILSVVRDEFGDNPFHHVLDGRIIEVVQLGVKYGKQIPQEFEGYQAKIQDHQNPHLNYRTLDDLRKGTSTYPLIGYQFIPPENRTIRDNKILRRWHFLVKPYLQKP